ncbi:unnamed protein product [Mesocestoides corti]|uniref:Uncharacterized protein n=1 Tax=Mesocestoides corti TaxID=53468 RepID=A0A0R3UIX2_MESCO|nr:unnamed protein product [Mesocestoides corti]
MGIRGFGFHAIHQAAQPGFSRPGPSTSGGLEAASNRTDLNQPTCSKRTPSMSDYCQTPVIRHHQRSPVQNNRKLKPAESDDRLTNELPGYCPSSLPAFINIRFDMPLKMLSMTVSNSGEP